MTSSSANTVESRVPAMPGLGGYIPESPRWLATHGRDEEAEEAAGGTEDHVRKSTGREDLSPMDEGEIVTTEAVTGPILGLRAAVAGERGHAVDGDRGTGRRRFVRRDLVLKGRSG